MPPMYGRMRRRPGMGLDATAGATPYAGLGNYGAPMPMETGGGVNFNGRQTPPWIAPGAGQPMPIKGGANPPVFGVAERAGASPAPFPMPGQGVEPVLRSGGMSPGIAGGVPGQGMESGYAPFPVPGGGFAPGIPGGVPGYGGHGAFGYAPPQPSSGHDDFLRSLPMEHQQGIHGLMGQGMPFDQAYRLTMRR